MMAEVPLVVAEAPFLAAAKVPELVEGAMLQVLHPSVLTDTFLAALPASTHTVVMPTAIVRAHLSEEVVVLVVDVVEGGTSVKERKDLEEEGPTRRVDP
jgi:hypothetical protein